MGSIASPPTRDTSVHSPKADFAGPGPLVRFGKPAWRSFRKPHAIGPMNSSGGIHPSIEWKRMAEAGSVYRRDYEDVAAPYLSDTIQLALPPFAIIERELV